MRFYFLILFAFCFSACSDKEKEYDKSKAISAFAIIDQLKADPALEKIQITIPQAKANHEWIGSASSLNQTIENFAFTQKGKNFLSGYNKIWSGYRSAFDDRFVFEPIIKNGKIFLLDAKGILECYDLISKKKIWEKRAFKRIYLKTYQNPKIGYFNGRIFAIAGSNEIVALSENDGNILWTKEISSIPISAPISDGKSLFVTTNDNKTYALSNEDGKLLWTSSGIGKTTAIFGAAEPLFYKNSLIIAYSSGEIYALNKDSGEPLWSQDLNLNKAGNSDFYLNDVDATPLIKNDVIYTIGNGGLMMAINAKNGNYLWKRELAGIADFWAADEFLYVINNDEKLLALHKKSGAIKWSVQLPDFKNAKKPETKIIYNGVIMINGKLVLSDTRGKLLVVSALDGKIEQTFTIKEKIYHSPIAVNGKIYLHALGRWTVNLIEIY